MRRKSNKPSNGLSRLVYPLCMESILMKRSIIIIRPVSRSESGLNKQDLKFSKTVMVRYGTITSCYERFRFIQRIKQRLTQRAPDVWESARFTSISLALGFSYISERIHVHPHAGNANRYMP